MVFCLAVNQNASGTSIPTLKLWGWEMRVYCVDSFNIRLELLCVYYLYHVWYRLLRSRGLSQPHPVSGSDGRQSQGRVAMLSLIS